MISKYDVSQQRAIELISDEMSVDFETAEKLYNRWVKDDGASTSILDSRNDMEKYLYELEN